MIYFYYCKMCNQQYSVIVQPNDYSRNCPYCHSGMIVRIRQKHRNVDGWLEEKELEK